MIELAPGDTVIMTHPLFDSHVIAEIVAVRPATVTVLYWNVRGKSDDPKIRKRNAVLGKLRKVATPEMGVQFMREIYDAKLAAEKAARAAYIQAVRNNLERL